MEKWEGLGGWAEPVEEGEGLGGGAGTVEKWEGLGGGAEPLGEREGLGGGAGPAEEGEDVCCLPSFLQCPLRFPVFPVYMIAFINSNIKGPHPGS